MMQISALAGRHTFMFTVYLILLTCKCCDLYLKKPMDTVLVDEDMMSKLMAFT
jgi:hypothetical protein